MTSLVFLLFPFYLVRISIIFFILFLKVLNSFKNTEEVNAFRCLCHTSVPSDFCSAFCELKYIHLVWK